MTNKVFEIKTYLCKKTNTHHGPFLVNSLLATVECEACHEKLNPVAVLLELAKADSLWTKRLDDIKKEVITLQSKFRCYCEYCGKLTRIIK